MASVSDVAICRIALGWLGANSIISLEDDSVEAALCKENYDFLRDAVLEEADWSFAIAEARLVARADEAPLIESGSFFLLPPDCIRVISVYDTSKSEINYWDKEGRNLRVDQDAILMKYIRRETDPKVYSPTFVQALAARIAATLAPPITNSNSVAKAMWQLYGQSMNVSVANDGLQGGDKPLGKSSLVDVRRGAYRG